MAIKVTQEQQEVLKQIELRGEQFLDWCLAVLDESGMSDIDGCKVMFFVNPDLHFSTRQIVIGLSDSDFGFCNISKGRVFDKYEPFGHNSKEYEILFADEKLRKRILEAINGRKPVPPDGLWLSSHDDCPDVDCWRNMK